MASPRITKQMRENIVKNTIDHTFGKQRAALEEKENALAKKVYKALYTPAQIKAMQLLGERFVNQDKSISVNLGGQRKCLSFSSDECFLERNQWYRPFVPEMKLREEIEEFFDEKEDLEKEISKASTNLLAMLESVQSFKKLRAVWPEGEKFYDMYDVDSEKPGVPAVIVTEINKMLGL